MRNFSKWLAIGALLATGSTALIAGEIVDTPSAPTTKPAHMAHLVKPWNELPDLTDDVKAQIVDIHEKADAEVHAIHEKEHADIMALLSDAQKAELADIEAKDKAAAADRAAKRHHGDASATTKPAD